MPTTTGDQINRALRLLGILAEDETPTAATSQDALMAMNQMIDSWNTERLSVYTTQEQVFSWPSGQIKRTIGPTGNFVGNRPILLDDATYYLSPDGVSHSVGIVNQDQYNSIAVKASTSSLPSVIFVNPVFPNAEMFIYPQPTQVLEWHFVSVQELAQPAGLTTLLQFPPGYMRAFTYNLAMEIAPEFGVEPSPQIQRIAMTSKRNLKRINNPHDMMTLPSSILSKNYRFNVYTGGFS